MKQWPQVVTWIELNCAADMQGAHNILYPKVLTSGEPQANCKEINTEMTSPLMKKCSPY